MHLVKEFLIKSAGFSLKYPILKLPKRMSVLLDQGEHSLKETNQLLITQLTLESIGLNLKAGKGKPTPGSKYNSA